MFDLVAENGLVLLVHELLVPAVVLFDEIPADVAVGSDQEILSRTDVGLRTRQFKGQHPDGNGNGPEGRAIRARHLHLADIGAGHRVLRCVSREEELPVLALRKRDRLKRGRVLEVFLHVAEGLHVPGIVEARIADVDLVRRVYPQLMDNAVGLGQACVVRLLPGVHANEILVIDEQLRAELVADVGEIAEPRVAVLVPDLDELEVEAGGKEHHALFVFELAQGKGDLAKILRRRLDDERPRFVLVLRHRDEHNPVRDAVNRFPVRKTHHIAHGLHRPVFHGLGTIRRPNGQSRNACNRGHPRSHAAFLRHWS